MIKNLSEICSELNLPICGDQLEMLKLYAELVMRWNNIVNLTGSKSTDEFVRDHIADGLAVVPHLCGEKKIIDVGSGSGIPGVVLKIMCPNCEITLLEPRARRARFLEQVRIELRLSELEVLCVKLQDLTLGPSIKTTTLVTRAFGKMKDFAQLYDPGRAHVSKICFLKAKVDSVEMAEAEKILGRSQIIRLRVPGYVARSLIIFNNLKLG